MYPSEYRYTEEHEWVQDRGDGTCVLGITEFAQEELGEVVYVELPEAGTRFDAGDEIGSVESVKAVAEIYTPLTGEVVEANEAVGDDPELLNEDPHGKGWLIALRFDSSDELAALMDAAAYQTYLEKGEG
jgi:glycine cleavage system H protein